VSALARGFGLGIAILGTGQAARTHGRNLARWFPGVRRWTASRSAARAVALAASTGASGHFGSYRDALADARVDAVLITTPPASHLSLTLDALRAGKHVVVEKPAFPHSADFDLVEEAERRFGHRVLVAENYFYKPALRRLRALVASGSLGHVRFVQINAIKQQLAAGWRGDPAQAGGGALFEGGVHWVDFLSNLGMDLVRVRAHLPGSLPGFERSAVLVGDYAQGAVGVLAYSWEIPGTLRGLRLSRIWGTRASVLFETNGLFLVRTGRRPGLWIPDPRDVLGYRAMFSDFLRSLVTGEPSRLTLRTARRDIELIEQAYAAVPSVPSVEEMIP